MARKTVSYTQWFANEVKSKGDILLQANGIEFTDVTIEINVRNPLVFYDCKFGTLKVKNTAELKFFDECECENIFFEEGTVRLFQFFNSKVTGQLKIVTSSGEIGLDNAQINNLCLFPNGGRFHSLSANLCTFNELTLRRFKAHLDEKVAFELCKVKSRMSVEYSILDDVGFNGFDLKYAELAILNSSIVEANYYSITWPMTFRVSETVDGRRLDQLDIGDVIKLQEIYRQLKMVSLNEHNKVDAKRFLKNEMRIYHRQIILQRRATSMRKVLPYMSLWVDSLMLKVNQVFTDYGESIIRPISGLALLGFLFFLYWMKPLGIQFASNGQEIDWSTTRQAFGYFFNFLNPVHSYEVVDVNGSPVRLFGTSDFFMRLLSGFLIYHVIRATRKFNFSV